MYWSQCPHCPYRVGIYANTNAYQDRESVFLQSKVTKLLTVFRFRSVRRGERRPAVSNRLPEGSVLGRTWRLHRWQRSLYTWSSQTAAARSRFNFPFAVTAGSGLRWRHYPDFRSVVVRAVWHITADQTQPRSAITASNCFRFRFGG